MQDYLMIGVVLKPQGIRGESKIKPYAADVSLFEEWKTLYVKENDAFSPVPCSLSRIHVREDGKQGGGHHGAGFRAEYPGIHGTVLQHVRQHADGMAVFIHRFTADQVGDIDRAVLRLRGVGPVNI